MQGQAAITEAGDTLAATASVTVNAEAAIVEGADTVAAAATVGGDPITADAAIVESDDTLAATASVTVQGQAAITEAGDTLAATATTPVSDPGPVAQGGGGPDEDDDAEKHYAERRKFIQKQTRKVEPVAAAVQKAAATHNPKAPLAAPAQPQKAGEVARATDAQAPARTRPTAAPRPAPQLEVLEELVATVDAAIEVNAKRQARQRRQKRLKALLLLAAAA